MIKIGEKLRKLRIDKKATQKQIAEYLDIASNSYQSFEYDKVKPSYENLIKLCEYFQCSSDYLLGLSDTPERKLSAKEGE